MSGIILLVLRIAMTVALYALLGWALLVMWRALKHEAFFLSRRQPAPLALELSLPETDPQTLHFKTNDVIVGRDPDCECILNDGTISARHVHFTYHHNQWWVEDLGSRNGTSLNGAPLTTATIVVNDDLVKCGQSTLRVILDPGTTPEYPQTSPTETNL